MHITHVAVETMLEVGVDPGVAPASLVLSGDRGVDVLLAWQRFYPAAARDAIAEVKHRDGTVCHYDRIEDYILQYGGDLAKIRMRAIMRHERNHGQTAGLTVSEYLGRLAVVKTPCDQVDAILTAVDQTRQTALTVLNAARGARDWAAACMASASAGGAGSAALTSDELGEEADLSAVVLTERRQETAEGEGPEHAKSA